MSRFAGCSLTVGADACRICSESRRKGDGTRGNRGRVPANENLTSCIAYLVLVCYAVALGSNLHQLAVESNGNVLRRFGRGLRGEEHLGSATATAGASFAAYSFLV